MLLDVDGVVVVLGPGSEETFEVVVAGLPVTVAMAARVRLARLPAAYQLVWASAWLRRNARSGARTRAGGSSMLLMASLSDGSARKQRRKRATYETSLTPLVRTGTDVNSPRSSKKWPSQNAFDNLVNLV